MAEFIGKSLHGSVVRGSNPVDNARAVKGVELNLFGAYLCDFGVDTRYFPVGIVDSGDDEDFEPELTGIFRSELCNAVVHGRDRERPVRSVDLFEFGLAGTVQRGYDDIDVEAVAPYVFVIEEAAVCQKRRFILRVVLFYKPRHLAYP